MTADKINAAAAKWWADRFLLRDKAAEFEAALAGILGDRTEWSTYVDYDPQDDLLPAVRAVTECRGCFFSADGLFKGQKFGLHRRGDVVEYKAGYGMGWNPIQFEAVR